MSADVPKRTFIEQIEVAGDQLLDQIKELLHEGNVRRIRILHDERVVLEIPVTLAVVGGLIAPQVAALAAFAAAVTRCAVEIVREADEPENAMLPAAPPSAEALPAETPSAPE
jgi:hypothetical protein